MNNISTKIVFFGTPDFVVPVLDSLCQNFEVVGVVTAPDKPVGRKQTLTPSPIKQAFLSCHSDLRRRGVSCNEESLNRSFAKAQDDIVVFTPEKMDADFGDKLQALSPELFVVAAYGKIIPQNILDIPKNGAINIHPSLLPKYRGASPIQSAILAGDKVTGISVIKMDEKMDHGPIVYAEEFSMSSLDNFQTLSTKMFLRTSLFLPKIIPAYLAGEIKLAEQDDTKATFCKMIKKENGYFDISDPILLQNISQISSTTTNNLQTTKLDRMIRAYYPWPTAWTRWEGKIVKFLPFSSHPELSLCHPERSEGSTPNLDSSLITQNDKFLIQMEGKKVVKLEEFLRGYPNFPIKTLI